MAKTKKAVADEQPREVVLWECDRDRCDHKIYGAVDDGSLDAEAERLKADHLYQHDDPEGWLSDQEAAG